jgi:hypothetical protein
MWEKGDCGVGGQAVTAEQTKRGYSYPLRRAAQGCSGCSGCSGYAGELLRDLGYIGESTGPRVISA